MNNVVRAKKGVEVPRGSTSDFFDLREFLLLSLSDPIDNELVRGLEVWLQNNLFLKLETFFRNRPADLVDRDSSKL